jgi:hypothetical protein
MEDVVTNTGNTVGAIASLPMVTPLYSIPEIAGATNLLMGYEGFKNLASDDGVKKTYNLFKNGDYLNGLKSAGGDAFNLALTLPATKFGTTNLLNGLRSFGNKKRSLGMFYGDIGPIDLEDGYIDLDLQKKYGLTNQEAVLNNQSINYYKDEIAPRLR